MFNKFYGMERKLRHGLYRRIATVYSSNRIACFLDAWRNADAISMDTFIIKRQKAEVYVDCNTLSP